MASASGDLDEMSLSTSVSRIFSSAISGPVSFLRAANRISALVPRTRLDSVNRCDPLDHFLSEWRLRRLVDLHELSSCMQQTEGEPDCSSLPHVLGQRLIGHIAINLQDTRIVGQLRRDLTFAATVREHIGYRRRRWYAPRKVGERMSPRAPSRPDARESTSDAKVERSRETRGLARIFACRYSVENQANFETTTWV